MLQAQSQHRDSITFLPLEDVYKRRYDAVRVTGIRPSIDGKLDEPFWTENGTWSELFVQAEPFERSVPRHSAKMKLFYDDRNIYVGVICEVDDVHSITRFLGNRDEWTMGDYVLIAFDPYHDFRAATQFILNAAGNKSDMIVTDDESRNVSWNAVWEGRTYIDEANSQWTAEFRIPFSQLRYSHISEDGIWGLHVRRVILRTDEIQDWSLIPRNRNGYVYSFGELHNMTNLPKARGIEIMPYAMGKYQREPAIPNSPYQTGNFWGGNIGLDAKVALSDYTLDIAVNPDYGQVEQDPSVMNLSAYETFFAEKRPFFLQGSHIFSFPRHQLFYSRRIGSMPHYHPPVDNETGFAETQKNVPIIAALKLTGTNQKGVTVGAQQSITAPAFSDVTRDGNEERVAIEPLTSFSIARVQKNWGGNTRLGGMATMVARDLKDDHLKARLPESAMTAGIDFNHFFNNRLYYIQGTTVFSTIHGTEEAMIRKQRNAVHYFQRLHSQSYLRVDSTRTSMTGTGGSLEIGRKGNSKWHISESFSWSSPQLDLNDVGYLSMADNIGQSTNISYIENKPGVFLRSGTISFSQNNYWNFGGETSENNFNLGWRATTLNRFYWNLNSGLVINNVESRLLRGGPGMLRVPLITGSAYFLTDGGKKLHADLGYDFGRSSNGDKNTNTLEGGLYWRAGNHLFFDIVANYQWNRDAFQYVTILTNSGHDNTYVMGRMRQQTYSLTFRAKANITPDLSIQFYGSPFTSTAEYDQFKAAADTRANRYEERFRWLTTEEENRLYNPDFRFNEFRTNLAVRWEYRPGSTFYVVWEHNRSADETGYVSGWGTNLDHTFSIPAINTIMVKFNYWFGI
jgi:hypothetical protein